MAENSITTAAAERIGNLGPSVVDGVVEVLVEREIKKRVDALTIAIDKLAKMEGDFRKLGPDVKTFDEAGAETSSSYSANRSKERKEAKEKITKLTNAINKALEKKDFSDVYNLAQGSSKDGGGKGKPETTEGSAGTDD